MPGSPSTRLALVGPSGSDAIKQGDDIIRAIITQLEAVGAGWVQGTVRPAASSANQGYFFVNTSTGLVSFSTGSAWIDVNPSGVYQPASGYLTALTIPTSAYGRSLLAAAATDLPGGEIGYDQITNPVIFASTVEASGTTIIACSAHTFDGGAVLAKFSSPSVTPPSTAGGQVVFCLFDGATEIGRIAIVTGDGAGGRYPCQGEVRFTPSAGSHTYTVTAYTTVGTGGSCNASSGGTGSLVPTFVRFTKA